MTKDAELAKRLFYLAMPLALAACTEFPEESDFMGGAVSQVGAAAKGLTNVTLLKLAYQDVVKKWSDHKKNFDMSLIEDDRSRALVHDAAATIDEFLSKMQSVRKGNTIAKALVVADIAFFKTNLTKAHDDLAAVYILYGDKLSDAKKIEYKNFLDELEVVSLKDYKGLEESSVLAHNLYDLMQAVKVLKSLN